MIYYSQSEKETKQLGFNLSKKVVKGSVISLRGSLGAGKTVFAKGFAEGLGITEAIVSPTFTLVQEYDGVLKMYHLDLYRLSGEDEFESMGGEDFLYPDGVTLIEWSEKIEDMLPDNTIFINITIDKDLKRIIDIKGIEL
ncbi:MAG: tRNA (adenosine(37)-N6)-threonylcarbamoyltransferase complex ATPase subunit type 1 TsaE [Spirochaetales bacterium]|uniref:tRNA (adenosine(37)-N6)-threonylcarbamoyltransferase complex ATPase subunit type 1 TsaE n=1 Tax=Bullifex sp. TaxID=2815808 RepID=UPI002A51C280|nr:tRNA (adenosine(37)-N6)-threonylcarbamoyltransferase complex ATPase subunit type 1 TsaE [Bullifex sp.]MDD5972586.1 tRNA (adenosine(37)-N6)-threonylcarbamoyltransferase complex ATPase subunit type 1 TsaE [Spirochaetales bacterium]MDD7271075.1 tRNA (adenosine(37)-N6)-threonylcarbamoyltransferase complex ATPase subunit type 1 TsaE [Spirochaetales bacterium]MDY4067590.1 tRNA (adenosine(37)-N6)-threonylcarbamoyltransferase complex ATPase subunit type 1 TsaE [Bullifex sp.]